MVEVNAPWRKTPLDNWSTAIDPSVMVGDKWVEKGDPGVGEAVTNQDETAIAQQAMLGRFMHPEHDTSMDRDV